MRGRRRRQRSREGAYSSAPRDHQPALVCGDDELRAVARAELGEQACEMRLDGERGDDEQLGDLGVGETAPDEREDLALAWREPVEHGARVAPVAGRRLLARGDEGLDQ